MSKRAFSDAFLPENGRGSNSSSTSPSLPREVVPAAVAAAAAERRYSIRDEDGQARAAAAAAGAKEQLSSRAFIAVQACETCRLKKTRCDEDRPCSLCKTLGVECKYVERKGNRKEASLSAIMSALKRVESKLDRSPAAIAETLKDEIVSALSDGQLHLRNPRTRSLDVMSPCVAQSPIGSRHETIGTPRSLLRQDDAESSFSSRMTPISFSQHQVPFWPAINKFLPDGILQSIPDPKLDYALGLEMGRPALPNNVAPFPVNSDSAWLERLSLSMVTGLSTAFFETFNVITPIMDREEYFDSLGVVIGNGFGYNTESCLVLNVLALGCLAVKAYEEGNFALPGQRSRAEAFALGSPSATLGFEAPDWIDVIREQHAGLRFLNEARRRSGVIMTGNDMKTCQFYLLSALYYNQIIRPMDHWSMINRACNCCLTWLTSGVTISCDDWEGDMRSRLFWAALMYESIVIQELSLPASGLQNFEDDIPIPKFVSYPYSSSVPTWPSVNKSDDTIFHFHFLAQVAHRIILTRIRNTVYFYSPTDNFPTPSLVVELHHQLDQWRSSLPERLKFDDGTVNDSRAESPAEINASTMLHGRYLIAKFHIGRPFFYKALHRPQTLTEYDLQACHQGLVAAMDWPPAQGLSREMMSSLPVKFGLCCQFFGQLLVFRGIELSPDARVRQTLPTGYKVWAEQILRFLEDCAKFSPTVAKDLEVLKALDMQR